MYTIMSYVVKKTFKKFLKRQIAESWLKSQYSQNLFIDMFLYEDDRKDWGNVSVTLISLVFML